MSRTGQNIFLNKFLFLYIHHQKVENMQINLYIPKHFSINCISWLHTVIKSSFYVNLYINYFFHEYHHQGTREKGKKWGKKEQNINQCPIYKVTALT